MRVTRIRVSKDNCKYRLHKRTVAMPCDEPTLRLLFVFLLAIAMTLLASGQAQEELPGEAETHANRGLQLAQEGNLPAAEGELRRAAKLAPKDPEILASFGTVLAMQKRLEESTTVFEQALKLAPADATVRRYLAANLWQLKRFPEAKSNLEILLTQHPDDEQARLLLGMVSENTRDYVTATKMLSSVPAQVRQQPESIAALARSYYHLGETQKARDTLIQLLQHPAGEQAVLLGSQIADQMRDYETAEKMLQSLHLTTFNQAGIAYQLGLVEYHAGDFVASQRTLVDAVRAGFPTSQIYNLLAWCYYRLNQPQEAVQSLNKAIALAPNDEANYLDLSKLLVAENSLPAALAIVRQGTSVLPKSAGLFEARGSIEAKVGQFTDAVNSYVQAVQLDSSRSDSLAGLAEAQFSAGMTKESVATFERAIKRFPNDAEIRASYGAALLKLEQAGALPPTKGAEEMFRAAVRLAPRSPDAHYQLGKLALEKGNAAEAVQELEQAAKLSPASGETHFALARAYRRAGRAKDAAREMETYQKLKSAPPASPSLTGEPNTRDRL